MESVLRSWIELKSLILFLRVFQMNTVVVDAEVSMKENSLPVKKL